MSKPAIKVPYIVTCQVTGLQKAYTSIEFVERKIANYGGDEAKMLAQYVCKDAKKLLREGKTVEQVIKALGGSKDPATVKLEDLILVKRVKVAGEGDSATGRAAARSSKRKTVKAKVKSRSKARKTTKKVTKKARKTTRRPRKTTPAVAAPTTPEAPVTTTEVPAMDPVVTTDTSTEATA